MSKIEVVHVQRKLTPREEWALERLRELEIRYREEAEPFRQVLIDEANRTPLTRPMIMCAGGEC